MSTFAKCDICGKILEGGRDNSAYVYLEWKISSDNKSLVPRQKQDDYCSPCTAKVQKAIEDIRRGQANGDSKLETPDTNPPQNREASLPKRVLAGLHQK